MLIGSGGVVSKLGQQASPEMAVAKILSALLQRWDGVDDAGERCGNCDIILGPFLTHFQATWCEETSILIHLTFLKTHTISPTKTGSVLSGQIPRAMGLLERACAM